MGMTGNDVTNRCQLPVRIECDFTGTIIIVLIDRSEIAAKPTKVFPLPVGKTIVPLELFNYHSQRASIWNASQLKITGHWVNKVSQEVFIAISRKEGHLRYTHIRLSGQVRLETNTRGALYFL